MKHVPLPQGPQMEKVFRLLTSGGQSIQVSYVPAIYWGPVLPEHKKILNSCVETLSLATEYPVTMLPG